MQEVCRSYDGTGRTGEVTVHEMAEKKPEYVSQ